MKSFLVLFVDGKGGLMWQSMWHSQPSSASAVIKASVAFNEEWEKTGRMKVCRRIKVMEIVGIK